MLLIMLEMEKKKIDINEECHYTSSCFIFWYKRKKNQNMIIFQGQKLNMYQYFVVIFKFYESNFNKKKSM